MGFDGDVLRNAQVLWDFHNLDLGLQRADFVLALGSHDERVPRRAAELVLAGYAPLLVPSGALGKVTSDIWSVAEGVRFAEIAMEVGVPAFQILIEDRATNTGENITFTRELLDSKGIRVTSGILVAKPYMKRRAYATASKQWSGVTWLVASPQVNFEEYLSEDPEPQQTIELMVGDLQRIRVYAERGFQIPQEVPGEVWRAYEALVAAGFDRYVMKIESSK